MSINIYWACCEKEWLRANPPLSIFPTFIKNNNEFAHNIGSCPAIRDECKNLFGLKSLYSYEFTIEENNVIAPNYGQAFYDWHVGVRDLKKKFFSFSQEFIFFTDCQSLEMTGGLFPYLENNNITEKCIVIPGKFDIGKWFRPLEFAFLLRSKFNHFKIEENEIFQYIKFHTTEKLNFIQFRQSDLLTKYAAETIDTRRNRMKNSLLTFYYEKFKLKKQILKEIKENLL